MTDTTSDPRHQHHEEGIPAQQQDQPGQTERTEPTPDHGESSYRGHGRLAGRKALITGGDSGIGRAAAIAFAREGADVAIVHMPEEQEDADTTVGLIRDAGREGLSLAGDLRDEQFAQDVVSRTRDAFGGLDVLVLNAGFQHDVDGFGSLESDDMRRVFDTNLLGMMITARTA